MLEGIEATVFRTIGDRPSSWELRLPPELLRLPEELARVDALLDDPAFFAPFAPHFHPVIGRPSTPTEWYLRLMFLTRMSELDPGLLHRCAPPSGRSTSGCSPTGRFPPRSAATPPRPDRRTATDLRRTPKD